jgi:nucleoside-diphosphate-sugar epimerase
MASSLHHALVTGGAGFIGSHLVEGLLERGIRVTVLDNLSTGRLENLPKGSVRLIEGSILDEAVLEDAMEGVSVVFHLAASVSVPASVETPLESLRVNAHGTAMTLEAARKAGVRRFIYSSSSAVYGDCPAMPKREDHLPDPISPYAAGKLAGEEFVRAYAACFGMECVSLRYFNVFGPRQRADSPYAAVIPIFLSRIRDGKPLQVFGDGEQTRDFTFVTDVVQANLRCLDAQRLNGAAYNIARGEQVSLNRLIEEMQHIIGRQVPVEHLPPRAGDIKHSVADISLAAQALNYQPQVPWQDGLRRMFDQSIP